MEGKAEYEAQGRQGLIDLQRPFFIVAVALLVIIYLLVKLLIALEKLILHVDRLQNEVGHALKPGEKGGYLAQITDQIEGVASNVEEIRNYQENGPFRASEPP